MRDKRHKEILHHLDNSNWQTVKYLSEKLKVSEMTIRRDLNELEENNLIVRLHGGAKIAPILPETEMSHENKKMINIELKENIAIKIAKEVLDNELIFLGAGTTIELACKYLYSKNLKIVTNSLPVFLNFQHSESVEVILIGGHFRKRTNSFAGAIADQGLKNIRFSKAFIGVNAIDGKSITNYNQEEGSTQQLALENAQTKYIVADHTKLDKVDFYHFFNLNEADYLIVDDQIDDSTREKYSNFTVVL